MKYPLPCLLVFKLLSSVTVHGFAVGGQMATPVVGERVEDQFLISSAMH